MAKRLAEQFQLETAMGEYTHVELSVWHDKGGTPRIPFPAHIAFSINPCQIREEMVIVPMGKGINVMVMVAPRYNERKVNSIYSALIARSSDLISLFVSGKREEISFLIIDILSQISL